MPTYAGINGVVRKLKEWPVGINGVVHQQKEVWAGVSGVSQKIFSSGPPLLLTWDIPTAMMSQNSAIQVNGETIFTYNSDNVNSGEYSIKTGDTIEATYGRVGTIGTKRIYFNGAIAVSQATRGSITYSFTVGTKSISITSDVYAANMYIVEGSPT